MKRPLVLAGTLSATLLLFAAGSCFADLVVREIAVFYELGRVAPKWDFDELHESMKNDVGLSPRVMANHDIGRLDLAWSDEDTSVWLMYGHPF